MKLISSARGQAFPVLVHLHERQEAETPLSQLQASGQERRTIGSSAYRSHNAEPAGLRFLAFPGSVGGATSHERSPGRQSLLSPPHLNRYTRLQIDVADQRPARLVHPAHHRLRQSLRRVNHVPQVRPGAGFFSSQLSHYSGRERKMTRPRSSITVGIAPDHGRSRPQSAQSASLLRTVSFCRDAGQT
jgi:hypothetical protein